MTTRTVVKYGGLAFVFALCLVSLGRAYGTTYEILPPSAGSPGAFLRAHEFEDFAFYRTGDLIRNVRARIGSPDSHYTDHVYTN